MNNNEETTLLWIIANENKMVKFQRKGQKNRNPIA
jgi:hypothetical protein